MPSRWSIRPDGPHCPPSSSHTTSALSPCRQNPPSSTRSKTSGSLCVTTGSRTESSNPTTILSTTAARLGTRSSPNHGASCPSECANGPTGSDQWELVLVSGFESTLVLLKVQSEDALDQFLDWTRVREPVVGERIYLALSAYQTKPMQY